MSHPIPRATLDTLREVLAGYNKIAEPGEKITDEGVEEARGVSENTAKRQKKFFVDIGILEKDGYDHLLTEVGDELGHLIVFNQDGDAKAIFRDLLDDWEPTAEILSHVDSEGISREDLTDKVALVTVTELTTKRKEYGAGAIVDALEWTGFIEQNEDGTYYRSEGQPEPTSEEAAEEEVASQEPPAQPEPTGMAEPRPQPNVDGEAVATPTVGRTGVDINLDVSGTDDPENVRQLLLAIRKGSQEDVENYAAPQEDD